MDCQRIWDRQQQRLIARAEQAWSETYDPIKWMAALDGADLHDQLFDVKDELLKLVRAGDAAKIGQLVIAVARDYVDVLARRECGEDCTSNSAAVARRVLAADMAALDAAIVRDDREQVLATAEEALL